MVTLNLRSRAMPFRRLRLPSLVRMHLLSVCVAGLIIFSKKKKRHFRPATNRSHQAGRNFPVLSHVLGFPRPKGNSRVPFSCGGLTSPGKDLPSYRYRILHVRTIYKILRLRQATFTAPGDAVVFHVGFLPGIGQQSGMIRVYWVIRGGAEFAEREILSPDAVDNGPCEIRWDRDVHRLPPP